MIFFRDAQSTDAEVDFNSRAEIQEI